jgi:hypothetical protein
MEEQITCLFRLGFGADDATDGTIDTAAKIVAALMTATRTE